MSRMSIVVRAAGICDIDAISTIADSGSVSWSKESIESCLQEPNSLIVAESSKGEIAGFIAFLIVADELQILNIAVSPKYQNKGIAKQLLRSSAEIAFGKGARNCFLEVDSTNLPAISLYRKLGFCETGQRPDFYATGNDAITMQAQVKSMLDE